MPISLFVITMNFLAMYLKIPIVTLLWLNDYTMVNMIILDEYDLLNRHRILGFTPYTCHTLENIKLVVFRYSVFCICSKPRRRNFTPNKLGTYIIGKLRKNILKTVAQFSWKLFLNIKYILPWTFSVNGQGKPGKVGEF